MEQDNQNSSMVNLNMNSQAVDANSQNTIKNTTNNDPYAYLDRNEFTSEKFKIEIRNLPKYYGMKEFKKLLNVKLKVKSTKIKFPSQKGSWIYVCFRSEEDKESAIRVLNKYKWKGSSLKVEEARPIPDPLVQKRVQNANEFESKSKKIKIDENDVLERIRDATTPLWRLTYEEQLNKKTNLVKDTLRILGSNLVKTNPGLSKWWDVQKSKFNGLPCEIYPIRHSDLLNGYRNKCEFTIGVNEVTGEKTIGFRLGSYATGSVSVAPISDIPNVPDRMKSVVYSFQKFIQTSDLDVFNPELHTGYWRQLTARYGFKTDQLMVIIGIHPQDLTESSLNDLKSLLKEYFTNGDGQCCNITSLYLQLIKKKKSQDDDPIFYHIYGETYITEVLLNRTFRISPQAFFQINTNATEILYESIAELSNLTQDVTLLDVCCGTGSIGICLSEKCGEVLGLEMSSEAIADAKVNASYNNVKNAEFFVGKAEDILSCVAQKATKRDIICIVDPPRAGLHQNALLQIRKNERINKLVYVSCNPKLALKNFVDLGRPTSKIYRREPFLPVKAVPVDLFPFTDHCELLIYFERTSDDKI